MLKRYFGVLLLVFTCCLVLPACSDDEAASTDPGNTTDPIEEVKPALAANQVAFHVPGMW